jgi:superoxide dismutase, Cu-Zn family
LAAALPLLGCNSDQRTDQVGAVDETAGPTVAPANGAEAAPMVEIELIGRDGQRIGTAQISEEGEGVRVAIQATNLPPGPKGFHFHETGRCDPPDFQSAGGHFAPTGQQHGLENPQGPHAGDMSNLQVAADGTVDATIDNPRVTLREGEPNSLLDADGTALVIHAEEDDQRTDPTGNSGDRIACGVLHRG